MNYQALIPILKLTGYAVFLGFASHFITRYGLKRPRSLDYYLSFSVVYITAIVTLTALVGFLGWLHWPGMLMASLMCFSLSLVLFLKRPASDNGRTMPGRRGREGPNIAWVTVPVAAALCGIGLAVGLLNLPMDHDVMTYHLFFPANWVQQEHLFIIPTFFGDVAPAYAPCNASLVSAFLGVPFGDDTLARAGQFPFLVLAILAVFLLSKREDVSLFTATIPVFIAILTPVVFRQGFSAKSDLAMGACFVAALYFLDRYRMESSWSHAVLFSLSFGLCIGTKFVALLFSVLFLGIPFLFMSVRVKGVKALSHVAILFFAALGTGGFWYIRNWIVAGNPVFPLDMPPFFEGLYSRAAMFKTPYHVSEFPYVLVTLILAYGLWTAIIGIGGLLGGIILTARRLIGWFTAYLYVLPVLICMIHFLVVPYSTQHRFLLPAVLITYLPYARFDRALKFRWPVRAFWGCLLLLHLFATGPSFHLGLVKIFNAGLIPVQYMPHVLALVALSFAGFFLMRRFGVAIFPRAALLFCAVFVCGFFVMPGLFEGPMGQLIPIRPAPMARYPLDAWAYVNTLGSGSTLAHAGNNVPYHVMGRKWQNHVFYANIRGPKHYAVHDFVRDCRAHGDCPPPDRPNRVQDLWRRGDAGTWLFNLHDAGAGYFFVTPMSPLELKAYRRHDQERYPVERAWADMHPRFFSLIFRDDRARIYRINRQALAQWVRSEGR